MNPQEKKIYDILVKDLVKFGGFEEKEIKITRIDENLFSVGTLKGISFYCDTEGIPLFNIGNLRSGPFFSKILAFMGYDEKKNNNGEYVLSRLYKRKDGKGESSEAIPLYSREQFSVWEDILFYTDTLSIKAFSNKDTKGDYHPMDNDQLEGFYLSKSIRPKDLIMFLERKQITQELYIKYMPKVIKQLPEQIGDIRLMRIRNTVTEEEITGYLNKKLITKDAFELLLKNIQHRDELFGEIYQQKTDARNNSKIALAELKNTLA